MTIPRLLAPLPALLLALSACVSAPAARAPTTASAPGRSAAFYGKAPEGLAGADARKLVALFGEPRLDVRESSVRKLQFTNGRCVLDAYLYAPGRRREAVVAHIDTRLASGADVDQSSCIQSLKGK
ncbi:MAG TPA: hypothetical protein VJM81_03275 [Rhizorhapis sp.]|nr:hypothetical protein [Rhizorhapis sp.]